MGPGVSSAPGASGAMGDQRYTPESLEDLEASYELGLGDLVVDLSHIDFSGETRDVEIRLGMGDAVVIVPPDTAVSVRGHVGMGEAVAFGSRHEGIGTNVMKSDPGTGEGQLDIRFHVGLGKGEVRRGSL
jgi:predicted membrane protein